MKQNLGSVDRVLRFALAFWWLGPMAPQFGVAWANLLIAAVGWIALIESFLGFCWLHNVLGLNKKK